MKIFVHAKPRSRENAVEKVDEVHYVVAVREPPVQGRANAAIVCALAEYFHIAPSSIRLIAGFSGKEKVFEVNHGANLLLHSLNHEPPPIHSPRAGFSH